MRITRFVHDVGGESSDRRAMSTAASPSMIEPPRVLLLDNYDSYTYNIFQYLAALGTPPLVVRNDEYSSLAAVLHAHPEVEAIVVSPGPGNPANPQDFGLCSQAYHCGLPLFGVCLGMQGLAMAFGGAVTRAPKPMHGRISEVFHAESMQGGSLLEGVPSPFEVVRYHSLVVPEPSLPDCLRVTARTADGLVMALEHTSLPLVGVQFHPESICTQHGMRLFRNFVQRVVASRSPARASAKPKPAHASSHMAIRRQPLMSSSAWSSAIGGGVTRGSGARGRQLLVCEPTLPRALSTEEIFVSLHGPAACSFWLDAADGQRNRFSYLGSGGGPHSFLVSQHADGLRRVELATVDGTAAAPNETPANGGLMDCMRDELAAWAGATQVVCTVATPFSGQLPGQTRQPPPAVSQDGARGLLPVECAFRGGFVGFLGYEAWHDLGPSASASELRGRKAPDRDGSHGGQAEASFLFADRIMAYDHHSKRLFLLCLCTGAPASGTDVAASGSWDSALRWLARQSRALQRLAVHGPLPDPSPPPSAPSRAASARFVSDRPRGQYLGDIGTIAEHLHAGESYEVCLTTTFRCVSHTPPPLRLYQQLRRTNPAPHAAYLRFDPKRLVASPPAPSTDPATHTDTPSAGMLPRRLPHDTLGPGGLAICCSSPERFLRVEPDGRAECKPIKGTVMREPVPAADADAAHALQRDEKSRSENLMIVDLIRNDLGRVCVPGSVEVPSLMHIESYATVHQLVSTVRGVVQPTEDALSAAAAAFPPGSMTGAPKARTMRIIDELEHGVPRGVYSGALGFFSIDGASDLNVVIRTAVIDERGLSVAAGGAVVALSDAVDEYEEVLLKARPVMRAVASCLTGGDAEAYTIDDDYAREDWGGGPLVDSARAQARPAYPRPTVRAPLATASATTRSGASLRAWALSPWAPAVEPAGPPPELFETMLYTPVGGFLLLEGHLERFLATAAACGYSSPPRSALALSLEHDAAAWPMNEASRVRLCLTRDGTIRVERAALPGVVAPPPVALPQHAFGGAEATRLVVLDPCTTSSVDPALMRKTTARQIYDAARRAVGCAPPGASPPAASADAPFDVLLHNEAGEVTECAIANVALQDADNPNRWATPPVDCGLLPGVLRAALLERGMLYERVLTVDEVCQAVHAGRRLVAFNSLRGCYDITLKEKPSQHVELRRDTPGTSSAPAQAVLRSRL